MRRLRESILVVLTTGVLTSTWGAESGGLQQPAQKLNAARERIAQDRDPPEESSPEPTGSRLRRQRSYEGVWPFWSHETFENGTWKSSSLLGLFRAEGDESSTSHHHLFPFYCTYLKEAPEAGRSLSIFPLLYFGWHGEKTSRDFLLPLLYFAWSTEKEASNLLFPLFYLYRSTAGRETGWRTLLWPLLDLQEEIRPRGRWLPPALFRHVDQGDESADRVGLPCFFEIFERRATSSEWAFTLGNIINFARETQGGLPLARLAASKSGDFHAHLFPLFLVSWDVDEKKPTGGSEAAAADGGDSAESAAGAEPRRSQILTPLWGQWRQRGGASGFVLPWLLSWWTTQSESDDIQVLFPLGRSYKDSGREEFRAAPVYFSGEDGSGGYRFVLPFYGTTWEEDPWRESHYLLPLLSHWSRSAGDWSLNVLWPLGHWRESDDGAFAVRALPLFDWKRSEKSENMGIGSILYRRIDSDKDPATGEPRVSSSWVLAPLVHWRRSPSTSETWAFPLFYTGSRDDKGPPDERASEHLWVAPTFFRYRSAHKREEILKDEAERRRSTRTLDSGWHLWPLAGVDESIERTEGSEGDVEGSIETTYSTLYPFVGLSLAQSGGTGQGDGAQNVPSSIGDVPVQKSSLDFHTAPLVWLGSSRLRTYVYLYPLVSVEDGLGADANLAHWTSLVQWYGKGGQTRFHLFPLLFWWEEGDDRMKVAGPLYSWCYSDSSRGGWFHLVPLGFGSWEERRFSLGVFPLYYHRNHGPGKVDYWTLARFFFVSNVLESDDEFHWSLLWKAFEFTESSRGDFDFRILHRLVVARDVEGQHEMVVNPLISSFSDERTGKASFSILTILYRWEKDASGETHRVLFFPVASSGPGDE